MNEYEKYRVQSGGISSKAGHFAAAFISALSSRRRTAGNAQQMPRIIVLVAACYLLRMQTSGFCCFRVERHIHTLAHTTAIVLCTVKEEKAGRVAPQQQTGYLRGARSHGKVAPGTSRCYRSLEEPRIHHRAQFLPCYYRVSSLAAPIHCWGDLPRVLSNALI